MSIVNIDANDIRVLKQNVQSRYIRLELLNYQMQTVDELQGVATSGSLTIDANADVRRTGSITLVVNDSSFEVQSGGKIWLDKYIRVWVGTLNNLTQEIVWTNCGLFLIDAPSYQYNPSTNTLSLSLLDLMAKATGLRNGQLEGVPIKIYAGESIRSAIIDTLELGGFTKYVVAELPAPSVVPNDLTFNVGATLYEVLSALRDIYPFYEMYFDVDGVFYFQPLPMGYNDAVLIDDNILQSIVLSEELKTDFQNVKNQIEVLGRTHNPSHYASATDVTIDTVNHNITATISSVSAYVEGVIYGFSYPQQSIALATPKFQINNLGLYPIVDENGNQIDEIPAQESETYFCLQWISGNKWLWLGHLQAYGYAEDNNVNSPYYINGSIGKIRLVLYDSDYANITSDNLAQQRAEYELYLHTNMQNTLTLSCITVPWFDVNIKVGYTMQRNQEYNEWLIKSVTMGLGVSDTTTVSMIKFYPQ